jgi:hypothetical protein
MEVDHFDPTLRGPARNKYSNLVLATRHCNNMKANGWPTAAQRLAGSRILNPTLEQDYGVHIFEDPIAHELVGATPEGRYHIDILDLNHETFVWERTKRAQYRMLRSSSPAMLAGAFTELRDLLAMANGHFETFIPDIPAPPIAKAA